MSGALDANVLVVTDVYPPGSGGSGWSTHALVRALRASGRGVEVMEIDARGDRAVEREFEGVAVTSIALGAARRSTWKRLGADDYSFATVRQAVDARLRRAPRVDLVHAQHLHSAPGAVAASRAAAAPVVVTVRDHWPICLHGTGWWGGEVCGGCSPGNVAGCLREYMDVPSPAGAVLTPWVRRRLRRRCAALRDAHRVVAVSEDLAARVRARVPGLPLAVVPNMVDADYTAQLARSSAPIDVTLPPRYLLAAGKLSAAKGFDRLPHELADAGCLLPLVIVGDGPLQAQLREQARARGLEAILPGWVAGESLLRLIEGAWAVIVPSRLNDSLPRVILESSSLGTPVIARRAGGSAEMFVHGEGGWLFDDVAGLAMALRALEVPGARAVASAAARRTALERFSPAVVLPRILQVYEAAQRAAGAA